LKLELNPWEGSRRFGNLAREGFASIPPEWLNTYFRWWGAYTQAMAPGSRAQGREGKAVPFFMLRHSYSQRHLHAHQLRTIAGIARNYAQGVADITVRQNIQTALDHHRIATRYFGAIVEVAASTLSGPAVT